MNRGKTWLLVFVIPAALWFANLNQAAADYQKVADNNQIFRMLDEQVEMNDFQPTMSVKEALRLLMEKFAGKGKELPIFVDEGAFRKVDPEMRIYEVNVSFQPFPRRLALGQVLQMMLSRVRQPEAAFLVRNGLMVITTEKEARPEQLAKRRVIADFVKTPFMQAMEELTASTGASIVLDIRLGDKLKAPVTASFKNDATLEAALRILTDMVDLKVVFLPGGIYVTHPFNADNLEKELKERRKANKSQDRAKPRAQK